MRYMKIRLLATDSKIPNIALMKISTYHKKLGDDVSWYDPLLDMNDTDILYESKVFTFSPSYQYYPSKATIIQGGTGIDVKRQLSGEIDSITELDYTLYPTCDYSLQFLSRGCVRNCSFCLVRDKEGYIHQVKPMNLNPNGRWIMLLDNNFFSYQGWRENVKILQSYDQPIDFTQGIDLRTLTEEQVAALSSLKIKRIHCAWDNYSEKENVLNGLKKLLKHIKAYKVICYVLVGYESYTVTKHDLERVHLLNTFGVRPFAMAYVDETRQAKNSQEVKDFCRWVNKREIFTTVKWEDYNKKVKTQKQIASAQISFELDSHQS